MRKKQILATIIALGIAINVGVGVTANAGVKNLGSKEEVKETVKEEVVKLSYNNSKQKVGEKLNLELLNAKAVNVNDPAEKYIIGYGTYEDTESPIKEAIDENNVLVKPGTYNIVVLVFKSEEDKLPIAEGVAKITVVEEDKLVNNDPVIEGQGAIIKQWSNFDVAALGIKATDKEDGDLTSKLKIESNVDTTKPGIYTVKASVEDKEGNKSTKEFSVVVKESFKPVLKGIAGNTLTIEQGSKFDNSMLKVNATDKEDGDITSKVTYTGNVDTSKAGTYDVVAKVVDKDGLEATQTFNVVVKEKAIKPEKPVTPVKPTTPVKPVKPAKPDSKPNTTKPSTGDVGSLGLLLAGAVSTGAVLKLKKRK